MTIQGVRNAGLLSDCINSPWNTMPEFIDNLNACNISITASPYHQLENARTLMQGYYNQENEAKNKSFYSKEGTLALNKEFVKFEVPDEATWNRLQKSLQDGRKRMTLYGITKMKFMTSSDRKVQFPLAGQVKKKPGQKTRSKVSRTQTWRKKKKSSKKD